MQTLTRSLRQEHEQLRPRIELLRTVADRVDEWAVEDVRQGVDEVVDFLTGHLIPHAEAEDRWLYPAVGRVLRSPDATATMSRDHVEVSRLAAELSTLRDELSEPVLWTGEARVLCRVLYGLYAILTLHFAKEEEIYLPLLAERLSGTESDAVREAMYGAERDLSGR